MIDIPLGNAQSKVRYAIDCEYLAVVTCPISVNISVNNPDSDLIPLPTVRALRQSIKYIYVTHTDTSTTDLKLLAFDKEMAEAVGFGASVTLSSPSAVEYDARKVARILADSTTTNLGDGATYTGASFETDGYNKIIGSAFANRDGDVFIDQSQDNTNWDIVDSIPYTGGNNDGGFSVEIVAPYARIRFSNDAGAAQTAFRFYAYLSTGA